MNPSAGALPERVKSFCAQIGRDPLLVQGAGGNVSWKEGGTLWVKASGTWLSEAAEKEIFVPVDLLQVRAAMAVGNFAVTPQVLESSPLRPSIETLLHALMPHKVVAHLHAIEVLAHLVRKQPEQRIAALLGNTLGWTSVGYSKPGADLAMAVARQIETAARADVIFLRNHGVVIGGADVAEVESISSRLVTTLRNAVLALRSDSTGPVQVERLAARGYEPCGDREMNELALDDRLAGRLRTEWALYPDHVVFLGPEAVVLRDHTAIESFCKLEYAPPYVFALGKGVFQSNKATVAHHAQLRCYFDVLVRQPAAERLEFLSEDQVSELLNWDAEKYRQRIR